MNNMGSIVSSFKEQVDLNSKIWRKSKGQNYKMDSEVRVKLLEIAYEFISFLDVNIVVSDIIITGSLANFNWSKYSDVDLHIVADFDQFSKKELPLYEELFRLKKTIYNDKHDITIYGYDVEVYVQNESESHFSSGVYSILNDDWLVNPKKENIKIDKNLIKSKAKQWMEIIDEVIENAKDEPMEKAKEIIKKYKEKLKKYRTCGLEKNGEYSDENIVFKILRRNGYIEKLYNFQNKHADKMLSLNESPQYVNPSEYTNTNFKPYVVGNSNPLSDKINPLLLKDIDLAAKNANVKVSITTAVSGHRKGTRHETGHAVDIAMVNGLGFRNENDANRKGILGGIRRFVDELIKMGYVKNSESGNDKAVLTFGFKGHDHHIHVSRKSDYGETTDRISKTDSTTKTDSTEYKNSGQQSDSLFNQDDLVKMFQGTFGQLFKPQS
jgi:predicted nucleotidyltransferase